MADSFRENLREELDIQGITVKELAAKTGISKATLECYLGARSNMPSADAAVKIARSLGVTVEYLVTGQEAAGMSWFMNPKSRELARCIATLDDRDYEIMSALARVLRKKR